MTIIDKLYAVLQAFALLLTALWIVCGAAANVLPDGKLKTAASYAGARFLKARDVLKGALPDEPAKPSPGTQGTGPQ